MELLSALSQNSGSLCLLVTASSSLVSPSVKWGHQVISVPLASAPVPLLVEKSLGRSKNEWLYPFLLEANSFEKLVFLPVLLITCVCVCVLVNYRLSNL